MFLPDSSSLPLAMRPISRLVPTIGTNPIAKSLKLLNNFVSPLANTGLKGSTINRSEALDCDFDSLWLFSNFLKVLKAANAFISCVAIFAEPISRCIFFMRSTS